MVGLIAALQAQSGADFGRAELKTELLRFGTDVRIAGIVLEAEVANRQNDELKIDFFLGAGNPVEDVITPAPVGDVNARFLERLAVFLGRLAGAELHRLPDGHQGWLDCRGGQFCRRVR